VVTENWIFSNGSLNMPSQHNIYWFDLYLNGLI